jgi:hypothetical protein
VTEAPLGSIGGEVAPGDHRRDGVTHPGIAASVRAVLELAPLRV